MADNTLVPVSLPSSESSQLETGIPGELDDTDPPPTSLESTHSSSTSPAAVVPPPPSTSLPESTFSAATSSNPALPHQLLSRPVAIPPPAIPSFRVAGFPAVVATPHFSSATNSTVLNPTLQPPGVTPSSIPGISSSVVPISPSTPLPSSIPYQISQVLPPNSVMGHYAHLPNGYVAMPAPSPQGTLPPLGMARYTSPYISLIRPGFLPRPPIPIGLITTYTRPPIPGIRPAIIPPVVRPSVAPAEKPQTTVYVGKISPAVANDFMLSVLQLCGPVKSWKRAQDPSNGAPKGFGFCEFESAEGVLRALRLLSKFNINDQELVLNVNQATREYLEKYVEKKTANLKKPEPPTEDGDSAAKSGESVSGSGEKEPETPGDADGVSDGRDLSSFGIVTGEDREADHEAVEKLKIMIEERSKIAGDSQSKSGDEPVTGTGTGTGTGTSLCCSADAATEDRRDDEGQADSPDRGSRRHDRGSRERGMKREKEQRVFDRYERERERERLRREKETELRIRGVENAYKERVKGWEIRERERENQRLYEREKEKEKTHQRKRELRDQERESDTNNNEEEDDSRKRRRRLEEKKRMRVREREEDAADRAREEEEPEEPNPADVSLSPPPPPPHPPSPAGSGEDPAPAPARKLGFGLVGSGKRTAGPCVFHVEDDDESRKDTKMRPLVPIDYSAEEMRAVDAPSSLVAAAEFARSISGARSRRSGRRRPALKDSRKLLDAKQLIDAIPRTRDELFSYDVNWSVYDTYKLHERMKPWISKKITEFLGEEEVTLVDYILTSTNEHVKGRDMLQLLQPILDEEAEMFVLKMWRMLIFEIRKAETGLLASRPS